VAGLTLYKNLLIKNKQSNDLKFRYFILVKSVFGSVLDYFLSTSLAMV